MDNALEVNPNMPNAIMLYLGNNPWRCDCIFTPGFQVIARQKFTLAIYLYFDVDISGKYSSQISTANRRFTRCKMFLH